MEVDDPLDRLFGEAAGSIADVPIYAAGDVARFGELFAAAPSIEDFLRAHRGVTQVHDYAPDGSVTHHPVDADGAVAAYRAGAAMDARDIQAWCAPARAWLVALEAALGLASGEGHPYCHAFIGAAGAGAEKHFDNREVFVLQLVGRKRWLLAPNRAWPQPLMPHSAGAPPHPYNRKAPAAALADRAMPVDAEERLMEPGSVLFVPRGYWHATRAIEPSLSLSFGVRRPTRVERFVERLRQELARDPAWRAPALDLTRASTSTATGFARPLYAALATLRSREDP